jgi:ABC-type Fe2+-enterobactin transport system substrate-binding protein
MNAVFWDMINPYNHTVTVTAVKTPDLMLLSSVGGQSSHSTKQRLQAPHGVVSQKTAYLIVTALKTPDLTLLSSVGGQSSHSTKQWLEEPHGVVISQKTAFFIECI